MDDSVADLLRRSSVEFLGTFILVCFVGLSNVTPFGPLVPGLTLMVCVFAGGHVSLGAYNPAVALALTLRPGLLSWKALVLYVFAELAGGAVGAATAWAFGGSVVPAFGSNANMAQIFFAEFLGTFMLTTQVLHSGTRSVLNSPNEQFCLFVCLSYVYFFFA